MPDTPHQGKKRERTHFPPPENDPKQNPPREPGEDPEEGETAQEWGERIETGKTIARGGQQEGDVPGAEEEEDQQRGS